MWSAQILRYLDETKSWIKNHTCKNCNFEINIYGFSLIACFFYGDVVEWCVFRIIISNSNRLPQPNHHRPHSITRPPQPETRLPVLGTRCQVPGTRYQLPTTNYQLLNHLLDLLQLQQRFNRGQGVDVNFVDFVFQLLNARVFGGEHVHLIDRFGSRLF